ncbi:hypothetical protein LJR168_003929 [Pseudoxanthomonas sp. LjRoot168]|uniref:hypothetical protein n=1 Tax=unclassified Pseudoxanthomonas TaxID=2645906 RepID=UPI003ED0111B
MYSSIFRVACLSLGLLAIPASAIAADAAPAPASSESYASLFSAHRAWVEQGMKQETRWVKVGQDDRDVLYVDMARYSADYVAKQTLIVQKLVPTNPAQRTMVNQNLISCADRTFLMGRKEILDDRENVVHVQPGAKGALKPAADTLPGTLIAWVCG